jgi:hypothetical protein
VSQPDSRGGAPSLVAKEIMWVIETAILDAPRSHQRMLGPSESGHPCARYLGNRLLGTKSRKDAEPNLKARIGIWSHAGLEKDFNADNDRMRDDYPDGRWITEAIVPVGEVNGETILGTCDLYDRWTATVIDFKTCGRTRLDHYRRHGPGDQYRTQIHLYGRGWTMLGSPVDTVMIVFIPRDGQLLDAVTWWESYDEQVAIDALDRLQGIATTVELLGNAALRALPTHDVFCWHCPYFKIGSTDPINGCPGDPAMQAQPSLGLTLNTPKGV